MTVPVQPTSPVAAASLAGDRSWRARLDLEVRRVAGRSVLTRAAHHGPLRVQRVFHPEPDGACHIYVLHPPGGVAGGDVLEIDVSVGRGSRALITTPSAQKLYRCTRLPSRQRTRLRAHGGALEWLPQETIAFEGAHARIDVEVDLDAAARFVGWDLVCLGRPASGEPFEQGSLDQRLRVHREGELLWSERLRLEPGSSLRSAPWGLAGHDVFATLIASPVGSDVLDAVRAAVELRHGEQFAASQPRGLLVCRFLGARAQRAHEVMASAWNVLRPAVVGATAVPPRIWAT